MKRAARAVLAPVFAAVLAALLATLLVLGPLGCASASLPAVLPSDQSEPRWQDAFSATPEVIVMVRPQALRRDAVYGAWLERAIRLTRARSRIVAATRVLDAIGDAEIVVVGMPSGSFDAPEEPLVVLQGVRADIDPMKLTDSDGRTLWSPGPSGRVRELVHVSGPSDLRNEQDTRAAISADTARDGDEASLFELPGRTWVIVTGEARDRVRDAFAHPRVRPSIPIDPDALASVRIAGVSLVAHVRALRQGGALAPVGHKLRALTLLLTSDERSEALGHRPPERSLRADLFYEDPSAAEAAEATLRRVIEAIAHTTAENRRAAALPSDGVDPRQNGKTTAGLEWLGRASIVRADEPLRTDEPLREETPPDGDRREQRVVLKAALPRPLLDDLLRASAWPEKPLSEESPAQERPLGH